MERHTTTVRRAPPPRRATVQRTEVHHYRHDRASAANSSTVRSSSRSSEPERERNLYVTGGMGFSGISAPQIAEQPMPGLDFQLGAGARRGLFVGELGFGMTGWRMDPAAPSNTANLTLLGMSADLKLQPQIAFFEPFVMAGVGGHAFNDHVIEQNALGASMRLGAGVDLRFKRLAISAQYMRSYMGFVGDDQVYEDGVLGAQTEMIGAGLKFYF